jgi:hypothetical protein
MKVPNERFVLNMAQASAVNQGAAKVALANE